MPAKKNVDYQKLIHMVENGIHQNEIMKAFNFNTAAQLKNNYLSALMEAGKAPALKLNRTLKKKTIAKEAFVNKRGSIIIQKILIVEMGFSEEEKFAVRKTKSGISLKKL